MGYLQQLKELCSNYTEKANTKEELDLSVKLNNIITGLEAEEGQNLKNFDDLKAAYKDAILHGTFGSKEPGEDINGGTKPMSFEEYLEKHNK